MKNMRTILFFITASLLLFSFSNCGSAQEKSTMSLEQNPPFKIDSSYYQDWIAGIQGGGTGTNIHITFKSIDKDVVIQNIYFHNQKLEAKTTQLNSTMVNGHLINDNNKRIIMDSDPIKEAANTPKELFPFELEENQAVIEYWFGGKKNYYKVSNLMKKEIIPYPKANQNSHE